MILSNCINVFAGRHALEIIEQLKAFAITYKNLLILRICKMTNVIERQNHEYNDNTS